MNSANPALPGALSSLSALIFLTLLWQCFTLLESSDLNTYYSFFFDGVVRQDKGVLFGLTFVETVCGLLALIAWFVLREEAEIVLTAFSDIQESALISLTYNLGTYALLFLNIYTMLSMGMHVRKTGVGELMTKNFWLGRMSWWEGRIEIEHDEFEKA